MKYIETRYLGTDGKIHTEKVPCGETPDEYKMKMLEEATGKSTVEESDRVTVSTLNREKNKVNTVAPRKQVRHSIVPKKK